MVFGKVWKNRRDFQEWAREELAKWMEEGIQRHRGQSELLAARVEGDEGGGTGRHEVWSFRLSL